MPCACASPTTNSPATEDLRGNPGRDPDAGPIDQGHRQQRSPCGTREHPAGPVTPWPTRSPCWTRSRSFAPQGKTVTEVAREMGSAPRGCETGRTARSRSTSSGSATARLGRTTRPTPDLSAHRSTNNSGAGSYRPRASSSCCLFIFERPVDVVLLGLVVQLIVGGTPARRSRAARPRLHPRTASEPFLETERE